MEKTKCGGTLKEWRSRIGGRRMEKTKKWEGGERRKERLKKA